MANLDSLADTLAAEDVPAWEARRWAWIGTHRASHRAARGDAGTPEDT